MNRCSPPSIKEGFFGVFRVVPCLLDRQAGYFRRSIIAMLHPRRFLCSPGFVRPVAVSRERLQYERP